MRSSQRRSVRHLHKKQKEALNASFFIIKYSYVLFSLRRKAPKDSLRLSPQTPSICWKMHTHGSNVLQCSRGSHRPPLPVREVPATGQSAPAGARRAPCERLPIRCQQKRRPADHASTASVDAVFYSRHRTATGRTNGQAGGLRLLFVLFLSGQEKDTFLLYQRRIKMSFSHRRENDEKSRRDGVSDSHPSAGKHIHTARKVLQCSRGSHRPPLPVREVCAAGSPRPQAQSCRPHKRSSRRLAASFRSFLVRRGKEHKMLIFFEKHIYKGIICKIILQIIPVNDILTL